MSDVEGRPASTMSTERRYGIAISVALILGGVYWALTSLSEDTKTSQQSYQVAGTSLAIDSSSTELEVRTGDVSEIKVDRRFERNALGSDPKDKYDDGKLTISDSNCGFLSFGCVTHYVVTVPKDLDVSIKTSSGDVKVTGLSGRTKLESSSGKLEAHQLSGDLEAESSSGDLEATDLRSGSVISKSSSGSIELTFNSAPSAVQAKSSSGDVLVQLPVGTETYKVDTDTSSGEERTDVRADPTSTRTITVETSSGDAVVEYDG
jgi:DUF4097 and DUF4098 domain-containing protein YvlB